MPSKRDRPDSVWTIVWSSRTSSTSWPVTSLQGGAMWHRPDVPNESGETFGGAAQRAARLQCERPTRGRGEEALACHVSGRN